jgi:predicted SAM-dependent methyltransferase
MKLNMGCGHNKLPGYINVDISPACQPDVVCDLEAIPWPWENDSIDEVVFNHSLEHLGESSRTFLKMMQELYRICKDRARIRINVPHPRHDDFINDPTHVRMITPDLLTLFDRKMNDQWKRDKFSNSPLAHYLAVDFFIENSVMVLDEPYSSQYDAKQLSDADLIVMGRELNNIAKEIRIVMVARKGA